MRLETVCLHGGHRPDSETHAGAGPRLPRGVLIRLSVGIGHADDIKADLNRALGG